MKGIKLTQEQLEAIQGKEFAPYQCFNPINVSGDYYLFLSENDKSTISKTEFSFLNDIQEEDVVLPHSKPSYL